MSAIDENVSQMRTTQEATMAERADDALWPAAIQVGEVVYPPGSTLGPRVQRYVQLVLLHSGTVTVTIDGTAHTIAPGSVFALLPGHTERFVFAQGTETRHTWLHAAIPDLPEGFARRIARLPWPLPLSAAMEEMMERALVLHRSPLTTAPALQKAIVMQMLWQYIGESEMHGTGNATRLHPAVERAREAIHARLAEPLTLNEIAEAAAVSPAHLVRLFRAALGAPPMTYVWERRVSRGVALLEQTGLPVGVVAETCGFQTSYHFSRRIRQATGLSPRAVRRRSWRRTDE